MVDPVIAADGHSYERSAIDEWFENKVTSPITNLPLDSTALLPNYTLLTQIKEWEDDQLKGRADSQSLKILKGELFSVSTLKEGQVVIPTSIAKAATTQFLDMSLMSWLKSFK